MSLIKENNESSHPLLSSSEDALSWEDIKEATWDMRSITQDMRRQNTIKIIDDIKRAIAENIQNMAEVMESITEEDIRNITETTVKLYMKQGTISGYQVQAFEGDRGTVQVRILPITTLENIDLRISVK